MPQITPPPNTGLQQQLAWQDIALTNKMDTLKKWAALPPAIQNFPVIPLP